MEYAFILVLISVFLLVINFVISIFLIYKSKAYAKDTAEAMSMVMSFLIKDSENNQKQHQMMQEWTEKTLGKVVEVQNENSQKIYDTLAQQQIYLSRLGEFFGYRPRGNVE